MKLTVLYNDLDDYLLYIDGEAYQDIDEKWAECIIWLKDVISLELDVKHFDGHRKDFPDTIYKA